MWVRRERRLAPFGDLRRSPPGGVGPLPPDWGLPCRMLRECQGASRRPSPSEWRDTPGWWNDDGNSPFGLEEFLGLWILFESYSIPDYAAMANGEATAVAQALYAGGYNPATCRVGGVCSNAVFNYVGANIDTKNPSALISGPNSPSNGLFVSFNPKLGDAANIRRRIAELPDSPATMIPMGQALFSWKHLPDNQREDCVKQNC
jgi:hypothetical protein